MEANLRGRTLAVAAPAIFISAAGVMTAYIARFLLQPVLGDNHAYSLFYPVILLSAYVYGRGPAIFAAVLSCALAFWTFVEPRFAVGFDAAALTPLAFFALTSGVGIYLITGLTSALHKLAVELGQLHAISDAHAGLFRDLQGRLSHHMTLIAGVLSFQARGEPDPEILALLRKAGERSQLIAQAHRDLAPDIAISVDFLAFTKSLALRICTANGLPAARIEVQGDDVVLPVEVATSLGVALAECLTWILGREPGGVLHLRLSCAGGRVRVRLSQAGGTGGETISLAPSAFMFRAMVEQLGASVSLAPETPDGPGLEITASLAGAWPTAPASAHDRLH